jgi:fibronectin-binding autotransporter adhesin
MKPSRLNPLTYGLFRRSYLTAFVVTLTGFATMADSNAQSISVNFGAGNAVNEAGKLTGAIPVAGNLWNNPAGNNGTNVALLDSAGNSTATATWTSANTWNSASSGATATSENGDLTRNYLDDGGTGPTVTLISPYLLSNVYLIPATDGTAGFSPFSVNGAFYRGDGAGNSVLTNSSGAVWGVGAPWSAANTLTEGTNFVKAMAQPTVVIAGLNSSAGRASLAGIQVVNAYAGTLAYWDLNDSTAGASGDTAPIGAWNSSNATWSSSAAGTVTTAAWTAGNAAVFSAGTTATGAYTVLVQGSQSTDGVWARNGTVTLSDGGLGAQIALTGPGLLRGDTGLTVGVPVSATNLTTGGVVALNSSANTVSGLASIYGTTTLGANHSFGSLAGGGTLAMGTRTLGVGSDNTDSTFAGLITGTGAINKSGTGRLTLIGNNTGFTGTTTISGGVLRLGNATNSGTLAGTIAGTGTVEVLRNDSSVIATAFTGAGTISFLGTGVSEQSQYDLSGATTGFTGTVSIDDSRLRTDPGDFNAVSSITVVNGGQAWFQAGTHIENYFINGNGWTEGVGALGAIRMENGAIASGSVTVSTASRIVAYGTTGTISGSLLGSANLEINIPAVTAANGTINLTGNATGYTGTLSVGRGTLNAGALGGGLTVNANSTANITGAIAGTTTLTGGILNLNTGSSIGSPTVTGGALNVNTGGTVTGALSMPTGTTLGLGGGTLGGGLTLGSAGTDTHTLNFTNTVAITGDLTASGTQTVNLVTSPSVGGAITLLTYTGVGGDPNDSNLQNNFVLGGAGTTVRPGAVFTDTGSSITMTMDNRSLTWAGTDGTNPTFWNAGATSAVNWTGGDTRFYNGDAVTFNDTATGVAVAMQSALSPSAVTFNNSTKNFVVTATTGSGITGSTGLTKSGTGTVTLGGTSTYTGAVTVNAGVLTLGSQQALGQTSGVTVASNARVDLNGQTPGALGNGYGYTWTIAGDGGDGAGNLGAITNTSATGTFGNSGVKSLVLSGNAEIGGNAGRFDVGLHAGASSAGTINGAGFTLTKVGSNQIVARGPASNITYVVNAGTLNFEDFDTASGTNKITVNNTAVMGTFGVRTLPNEVDLNAGTTLSNLGGGTGTWTGTINALGNTTFSVGGGNIVIDGALAGSGNITRTGANTLVLQNTGTSFSGKFINNGGTLRVESGGALGTATGADALTMAAGTTLQGGTISALASATIGSATQGITQAAGMTYDAGAGNTLTIDGAVTGTAAGVLEKANNSGSVVFNRSVSLPGSINANGGSLTFNGNLTLGDVGSSFRAASGLVTNLNSPTLTVAGGMQFWVGTTNIAIGSGSVGYLRLQEGSSSPHTINHTAGTLNVARDIRLGHWSGAAANVYNISSGMLSQPDTVTIPSGQNDSENQANLLLGIDGIGVVNISGTGVVNTTSLVLDNRGATAGNDTLTLTGGTLNIGKWGIRSDNTGGSYLIELGGGTIGTTSASATPGAYQWSSSWSSSLNMTLTGTNGDTIFSTGGNDITLTGVLSGPGGLKKQGAGNLVLSNAAGTFAGTALVEGGRLYLNSGAAAGATVATATGGTVQSGTPTVAATGTVSALTLNGGAATFRVSYTTSDKLVVSTIGGFTVPTNTAITVVPAGDLLSGDQFTLIDYAGGVDDAISETDFNKLQLASLPNPHYGASLSHDIDNTAVMLTVDAVDTITWTGNVDGNWDVNTSANWRTDSDSLASNFYESDIVKLDDVGIASQPTITLVGTIQPASVAVANSTGTYTLQGSGLSGITNLVKSAAGNLVLLNNNTNTGATSITGGSVTVGNGGTTGALGGAGNITLDNATLAFNRSDAQTLSRTIAGADGTFIKNGSNTLTMSAGNNTCDIVINNGTLAARGGAWATSFAANRTITVNAPGILDTTTHALNGLGGGSRPNNIVINEDAIWKLNNEQQLPNVSLTLTAGIVNGPGDVRGTGTITTIAHATKSSQVNCPVNNGNGAVTFNVADGDVATDLAVTGAMGGGNAYTKTGAGKMLPSGNNTYTGGTNTNGGVIEIATIADAGGVGGIGTGYLGIANDATFRYTGIAAETTARNLWIDTGTGTKTIEVVSATGAITFTSTAGNINKPFAKTGAGALTINDVMQDGTVVTVNGGKLTLGGTNTYTGDTTINAGGTLVIDGDSIANAGALKINGSGKVEVTETVDPVIEVVDTLWIDGAQLAAGTYGASGSGATNIDNTHFAGAGVVEVTTGPAGYASWSLQIADDTKRGKTDDADGDGFTNHQEFLFGKDPSSSDGSLTTSERTTDGLVIRWSERTGAGAPTYRLLENATLADPWTQWVPGVAPYVITTDGAPDDQSPYGIYQPMKATIQIGSGKDFFRVEGTEN